MVENTKQVVRFLQKDIQKIGQTADFKQNGKIRKILVLKRKGGSYIRSIDQQSTDQKEMLRKKKTKEGDFHYGRQDD